MLRGIEPVVAPTSFPVLTSELPAEAEDSAPFDCGLA